MNRDQIHAILSEIATVASREANPRASVAKTLERIRLYADFSCGLILVPTPCPASQSTQQGEAYCSLYMAQGDPNLVASESQYFPMPNQLLQQDAILTQDLCALRALPLAQGQYQAMLAYSVSDIAILVLLAEQLPRHDLPLTQMFLPVIGQLAQTLRRDPDITFLHQHKQRHGAITAQAEMNLRTALDSCSDSIYIIDPQAMRFIDFNLSAVTESGFVSERLARMGLQHLLPRYSSEKLKRLFSPLLTGERHRITLDTYHVREDTTEYPVEITFTVSKIDQGRPYVIALCRNISDRVAIDKILYEEKERALVTLHSIGDAVVTTDGQGVIDYMNPMAERLSGWRKEEGQGRPLQQVVVIVDDMRKASATRPIDELADKDAYSAPALCPVLVSRNGVKIAIETTSAAIRDRANKVVGTVCVFRDVTQSRKLAQQLQWQASHDSLTGLVNRREFKLRIQEAIEQCGKTSSVHALLYMDLDQFKYVNDTCGHIAGDELLKQLASLFQVQIRQPGTFARLGGDEFGLLILNSDIEIAMGVAQRLQKAAQDYRFTWDDISFDVGVSIGVTLITREHSDFDTAIQAADSACYLAKNKGKNNIHVQEAKKLEQQAHLDMQWAHRLTRALDKNQFVLYGQKMQPTMPGEVDTPYYEVLVRMLGNNGDIIAPKNFLPAAERYSLMPALDRWVIRNVFQVIDQMQQQDQGHGRFSINLAGSSIMDHSLLAYIKGELDNHKFGAEQVCFELPEVAALTKMHSAERFISEIMGMGFTVALDDFSGGLASLDYFKSQPIEFIKIDGSFIRDMVADAVDLAVVEAINRVGHVMGIKTIAECVENRATAIAAQRIGIDYLQGYGIERPARLDLCLKTKAH